MKGSANYEILTEKIEVFIRKYYLNKVLRGIIIVCAALFCSFLLVLFSQYLGNFDSGGRGFLFFGYWIVNLSLFCYIVVPPLLSYLKLGKVISHDEAARIIGEHFSHVEDKLLNTLQLKRLADHNPAQQKMIEASIDQKIMTLKPVTFPSAVKIKENVKYAKWVALPLATIIILAVVAPSMIRENTEKIIQHDQHFAPKAPFQFEITNARLSAVQGQDIRLQVKLTGNNFPEEIYVETEKNEFKMNKESTSRFSYSLLNLQRNVKFRLKGNDFRSQEYIVTVNPKPSLLNFDVILIYPGYLKRKNEFVNNAGDLTIPAGTIVSWKIRTKNASRLLFNLGGKAEHLTGKNNTFQKTGRAVKSAVYSLRATSDKVTSGDSVSYQMNVIADQAPTISVDEKQDSVSAKAVYFSGLAQDDHGFSSLIFHYTVKNQDEPKGRAFKRPMNADLSNSQAKFFYYWNINDLNLRPGAQVSYYFEVTDNNDATGRQTVRTQEHTLRTPTEAELDQQMNANAESVREKMQSAINLTAQLDKDIKKLNELFLNKANLTFDDKKKIQDLLNKRQELKKMIQEAQQQNQRNQLNRRENMPMAGDMAEKQQRMEKLMNDLLDPKTDEMLKMLQNLMENKSESPAAKDLAKLQQDDKALGQQLDRTLELMKQLDVQTKVQENIDRLKRLADRQEQLAEQTKQNNADNKSLQQKQEEISKDFEALKKSLDDVMKKNDQLENKTNLENPKADLQKIEAQMEQSSRDLAANRRKEANAGQQDAAKRMEQLAQKMQKNLKEDAVADIVINGKHLRNLIRRLVGSSFDQENIIARLREIKQDDPSYGQWAQKQKYIQANVRTMQDSLIALSKRLPEIESTVISETALLNQNIAQAVEYLEDRRTSEAAKSQRLVMTSMNNLSLMLSETLTKMQEAMKQASSSAGGSSGARKGKTLLQLSEMQQKLNANMQAMRQKMRQAGPQFGKTGSPSGAPGEGGPQSEQFARMARQQAEIRQAIEQINREENKDGHQPLGDLAGLAKQMAKTEEDLVNKRLTDGTLSRQLQIRTRLLEAEKADQERDQDSKREGKVPQKDFPPGLVKALQLYEVEKNKQTEQLRTVPPTLNDYFKFKVSKYFEAVSKRQEGE